jgi:hypothetical protein
MRETPLRAGLQIQVLSPASKVRGRLLQLQLYCMCQVEFSSESCSVQHVGLVVCLLLLLTPAGVFNSFKSTYDFQLQPTVLDDFTAILTIRHPNISTSFSLTRFRLSVSPNPAAATATTNTSSGGSGTAAPVTLFNPLLSPRLACGVTLPMLSAATYSGGGSKLLSDFNSIVASNAVIDGPAWVQSSLTSSAPVTINTTVSGRSE